jgi:hypothetical protein
MVQEVEKVLEDAMDQVNENCVLVKPVYQELEKQLVLLVTEMKEPQSENQTQGSRDAAGHESQDWEIQVEVSLGMHEQRHPLVLCPGY